MRSVSLPDRKLTVSYEDQGAGLPLVLLHAFPLCRWMWKPQIEALATHARVLTPDLPGFGSTPPLPDISIDIMADIVSDFLKAVGVTEPVILGGLSMGGYVAMAMARRHPQRLRGLILADTRAEPDDDAARRNRNKQLAAFADGSLTPAGLAELMIPRLLSEATRSEKLSLVSQVNTMAASQDPQGITAAIAALRDRPDSLPFLGNISVPTLIICGEDDTVTPPEAARTMAGKISRSRVVLLPGAGHLSNLENTVGFNTAVLDFLGELPV